MECSTNITDATQYNFTDYVGLLTNADSPSQLLVLNGSDITMALPSTNSPALNKIFRNISKCTSKRPHKQQ
jgi:hypothetical protein